MPDRHRTPRRDGTLFVIAGALTAALGAYLYQFAGGRVLGTEEFAPITVLWTVQFLVWTIVLIPLEHMTVRRLALSPGHRIKADLPLIVAVVASTAVVVTALMYAVRDDFLDGKALHALQAGLIVLGYGVYVIARGALAGRRRFRDYGVATAAESLTRLVLGLAFLAWAATSVSLTWAMIASPWVILALRPFRRAPTSGPHRALGGATAFVSAFILANAASHTILAAGPLVVGALGADSATISVFFVTLIIVRVPLTISYGLQSRLLEPLARMVAEGRSAQLVVWAMRIVASGGLLLVPAWFAGRALVPGVVQILFGAEFRPPATVGGLIAVGVVGAMASVFTAQMLVARGQTAPLAAAWIAGLVAAALTIVLSTGAPEIRTGLAFMVGEIVALAAIGVIAGRGGAVVPAAVPTLGVGPAEDIL